MLHGWDSDDYDPRAASLAAGYRTEEARREALGKIVQFLDQGPVSQKALQSLYTGKISTDTVGILYWAIGAHGALKGEFVRALTGVLVEQGQGITVNMAGFLRLVDQAHGPETPKTKDLSPKAPR